MEYDSASSCDERLRESEPRGLENPREQRPFLNPTSLNNTVHDSQPKVAFNVNKSLSKQVMEYYKKYSQNSNLDQYFSLPETTAGDNLGVKYYYSIYELNHKSGGHGGETSRQDCVGQDYSLVNYVPRERRRWARPPLIGQSSSCNDNSSIYRRPLTEPRSPSPEPRRNTPETIPEEKNESRENLGDSQERKSNVSPTSSVTSHKPLEWDSGADVGYFNTLPLNRQSSKKLSTIERMALARGCSAALRQDPEGTTESSLSGPASQGQPGPKSKQRPDANSTPLPGALSETESEAEITPIVKNHVPGIITGDDIKSDTRKQVESEDVSSSETPKTSHPFKVPAVKYATEGKKSGGNAGTRSCVLKKSSSMNILAPVPSSKLLLKRSQSDLNLLAMDKGKSAPPLIFDSTSSLATIVNKPATCDKVIQTTISERFQESIGVQVSVLEEEKPPVPKRGTSLVQKSILKGSKNTYKVPDSEKRSACGTTENDRWTSEITNGILNRPSSTDASRNDSRAATPQPDDTENVTGRANSFEYFPGHVYENVPNGSESQVSTVDTRRSNSTMPNTSSSIDEKLWGDSDSLVRDLERSVNILKSLVDANKCDKQVKKRLIHHVVKRLVTAKYTDDKIEHNLEENVPWNPDDARKKVYRTDIIQALTKKQNTTDSSDEWKPSKKKKSPKKQLNEEVRVVDEMITLESSNSDKFDVQTDRTEMDGRKARMGLRADDCQRSSNSPTDANKSESSECFLPQRRDKAKAHDNIFYFKQNSKIPNGDTSTSDNPLDQKRIYLDASVGARQSVMGSSNSSKNSADWRMPTTLSERQFELRRPNTSESGDSKLVSYAETEKKNQLLWITNEISHLSNLKKLLEQPKKSDRPRMSPKKIKHAIVTQKPLALLKCACGGNNHDNTQRTASDICDESIKPQWSSHCNLATCQSTVSSSAKNFNYQLKKRNSCTQTGTEPARAHSQTGSEITSPPLKHHNSEVTSVNIHVQTSPSSLTSPPPLRPRLTLPENTLPKAGCPVHKHSGLVCQCGRRQEHQEAGQNLLKNNRLYHFSNQKLSEQSLSNAHHHQPSPLHFNHQRVPISNSDQSNRPNQTGTDIMQPISHGVGSKNRKSEPKEAKNKVNASKSMCTCDCGISTTICKCVGKCLCEIKRAENGSSKCDNLSGEICNLCRKKVGQIEVNGPECACGKSENNEVAAYQNYCTCEHVKRKEQPKLCGCSATCKCENRKVDGLAVTNGIACEVCYKTWGEKICQCFDNCKCENRNLDQAENGKKICNCYRERKCKCNECAHCLSNGVQKSQAKHYYSYNSHESQPLSGHSGRLKNDGLCKCGKECCCENKLKDIERRLYSPKRSARTNCSCESRLGESDGNNQQHCRSCGSMYKNGRKCNCHISYPKPIAYELSFTDGKVNKNSDFVAKKNDKIDTRRLPEVAVPDSPTNTARSGGGCLCDEARSYTSGKNSGRTKTLQDYLAQNKPDFVNNVETRQQCMFEISHLRELRREKRVQLLALASGSNLSKTSRTTKPKVLSAQRKISDEEMKERLRKRYYRLHEVRSKRQQREKQEQARRNKLMANIFGKKLQQKVLKGQVDLSNSVSVISNL
ncbi:uncharacterized protein [Neodiprion pinetum]|uniref:uncharacterized protein isoform X1 n=1 Tax=Neodiprion pinetum TaxID=441929 RepID=UPI001EE00311|nr:uncharacterized protein LOC124214092 isoform X1 [Neodiprion pinetum]